MPDRALALAAATFDARPWERGLHRGALLVVLREFGRTPTMNAQLDLHDQEGRLIRAGMAPSITG
jgi:hypothetical protein